MAEQTEARTAEPMAEQTEAPMAARTAERMAAQTEEQTPDDECSSGPPVNNPRPALSRCVPVEQFAVDHWGEEPLLSHTDGFADLFGSDAVDELVTVRGLRTPFLRMAREGAVLPSGCFTSGGGVGALVADQADGAKIHTEMADGATLVLQGLHRIWPPLQAFTRQLGHDLGHPTQCNAYVTPPAARGFDSHYDTHDVFVLQIHGTKQWRIHRPVVEHPSVDEPWDRNRTAVSTRAAQEPFLTTTLAPGDVLYIPRGWLHSAATTQDTSIHLTMGVHTLTGADILTAVLEQLLTAPDGGPGLRRNLPLGSGTDPAILLEACEKVLGHAESAIGAVDPELVAASVIRRLGGVETSEPLAPLAQLRAVEHVDLDTQVRVRSGLRPRINVTAGRVRLTAGGRYVEASERCADALAAVASGDIVTPRSLSDVPPQVGLGVVREALRQGIVIRVEQ